METKNEIWKPIEGYEGYYEVSNLGRIKSVARLTIRKHKTCGFRYYQIKEKIMKQRIGTSGYWIVNLHNENRITTIMVHRLVAKAFVPNPQKLDTVNHKDENRKNNKASNLQWMTQADNVRFGTGIERNRQKQRKRGVIMLSKDGKEMRRFDSLIAAERFIGKSQSSRNIILVCNHTYRHPTAYGYKWEWDD